jgi:hypothetical protein
MCDEIAKVSTSKKNLMNIKYAFLIADILHYPITPCG